MNKDEKKIEVIKKKIDESKKQREGKLILSEMKKIGIEELPYSYSALQKFIDSETMSIHYNKHYKGYVDKLNDALSKRKGGSNDLEQIIKNISGYSKKVRDNAGGAFNHALFWNMLTPNKKKLEGVLLKEINKNFGSFKSFRKKFEEVAKERFGSGWVWLILTKQKKLKIMSTQNQDNPLMNVIKDGGFPLLGLDLWEHAYYLKYRNKRDEYIANFWEVVNWDFVTKMFEIKTETSLMESLDFKLILENDTKARFCSFKEREPFNAILNDSNLKKIYSNGIVFILKKVFGDFWVEDPKGKLPGFYGVESKGGRSILNNLNTNQNGFCLMNQIVNTILQKNGKENEKFNFEKKENRNEDEVKRFLRNIYNYKEQIFTKNNPEFVNLIKVLLIIWDSGKKSEDDIAGRLKKYYEGVASVEGTEHGDKSDALKGIDLIIKDNQGSKTAQVKPYSGIEYKDDKIIIKSNSTVQKYNTDLMIFYQIKSNKILIFDNKCIISNGEYVFPVSSKIDEIEYF